VYQAFFNHIVALESAAVEHDKAGRKGDEVRAYYQKLLKLTDVEAADLKRVATDYQNALHDLEAKAKSVVEAAWAPYPNHRVPLGAKVPEMPEELNQLERERVDMINAHAKLLEALLDPATFKRVDNYVQNVLAKQVTISRISPLASHSATSIPPAKP
jgi:hypothetical protein